MAISQFDQYIPAKFVSQHVPLPFDDLMQLAVYKKKELDDVLNLIEEKRSALDVKGGYSTQERAKAFRELKDQKLNELVDELLKTKNTLGFKGKISALASQLAPEYYNLKRDEEYSSKYVDEIRAKDPKVIFHNYDPETNQWVQQKGDFDSSWYNNTGYQDVYGHWLDIGKNLKADIRDAFREGTNIIYGDDGRPYIMTTTGKVKYLDPNSSKVWNAALAIADNMIANRDTDKVADYYFRSNKTNLQKTREEIAKEIIDVWKVFSYMEEDLNTSMKPVGIGKSSGSGTKDENDDNQLPFGVNLGQFEYQLKDYDFNSYIELMDKLKKSREDLSNPETFGFNSKNEFDNFKAILSNLNIDFDEKGNIKNRKDVIKQLSSQMTVGGLPVGEEDAARYLMNYEIALEKNRRLENFHKTFLKESGKKLLGKYTKLSDLDKTLLRNLDRIYDDKNIEKHLDQFIEKYNEVLLTKNQSKIANFINNLHKSNNLYDKVIYYYFVYSQPKFNIESGTSEGFKNIDKENLFNYIKNNLRVAINDMSPSKIMDLIEENNEETFNELFADKRERSNLISIEDEETAAKRPELNKIVNIIKRHFGSDIIFGKNSGFKADQKIDPIVFTYPYIDTETGEEVKLVNGEYENGIFEDGKIHAMRFNGFINTRDGYYAVVSPLNKDGEHIKHKDIDKPLTLMVKLDYLDREILKAAYNEDTASLVQFIRNRLNSYSKGLKGNDKIVTNGNDGYELIEGVPMIINRSDDGRIKAQIQLKDPYTGNFIDKLYEFKDIEEFASRIAALRKYLKTGKVEQTEKK
jgi:hypothetical protein